MSDGSLSYVRQHLAELFHGCYLQRVFLPTITPMGTSPAVYCLDNLGHRLLRDDGLVPPGRFRGSEQSDRGWLFLRHTLLSNDLVIAGCRLQRTTPGIILAQLRTEYELKRSADYEWSGKKKLPVEPDGWLDCGIGRQQTCIAFELDRGTEGREAFQRKVREYLKALDGSYAEAFGTDSLTVAVVTTAGQPRLKELLAWTEAELRSAGAEADSELFLFAELDPATVAPPELYLTPIFVCPFDRKRVSLLIGTDEG